MKILSYLKNGSQSILFGCLLFSMATGVVYASPQDDHYQNRDHQNRDYQNQEHENNRQVRPSQDDYRAYRGRGRLICYEQQIRHVQSQDHNQIAGTAIGAIAGGLLGNQIGGGRGKTLATVAGAVGGGYAGHEIQKNNQRKHVYYTTERKCYRQ